MLKKIETAKSTIQKNIDYLRCPLCASAFTFEPPHSIKCQNGHSYDISRKGYINLFGGHTKIGKTYDKNLFTARKTVSDAGLYDILRGKLCEIMPRGVTLDAGCGCGNLTAGIFYGTGRNLTFAVDLSKDGISFAAGNVCEEGLMWIVGNLNNLPVADNQIDVILNIMSPANYAEFIRIMRPGGVLIKVMPDADYLKELRRFIYKDNDKNEYSNKDVLANLAENMAITDITDVKYTHTVAAEHIPALFDMTPLTQGVAERGKIKAELSGTDDFEVTLAFKIAACKKEN